VSTLHSLQGVAVASLFRYQKDHFGQLLRRIESSVQRVIVLSSTSSFGLKVSLSLELNGSASFVKKRGFDVLIS
jgi:hypothetical protein